MWISYNNIDNLEKLKHFTNLKKLYIGNNNISDWNEIDKLKDLQNLTDIVLVGNPLSDYRIDEVFRRLP